MNVTLQEIAEKLKKSKRVAIFTHMRPDGDAYGSSLALSSALTNLGIENCVLNEAGPPSNLTFVEGVFEVRQTLPFDADTYVAVDNAELSRLGALSDTFARGKGKKVTINVDHHISNTRYAEFNFVRECAANCMNMYDLVAALGAPLDKKTAEYLLTGLLTDSGNFSHDDVTEETLSIAARLVGAGADIRTLTYELFKKQPKERAALYADVMGKIRYFHGGRFALIAITQELMQKHNANYGMTEGFVDFPLNVDTVEVAVSLMEMKKGQYKVSLRSKTYADVNRIAGAYGGGGHVRAAGCMLFGELEEVIDKLSYTVSQYLED